MPRAPYLTSPTLVAFKSPSADPTNLSSAIRSRAVVLLGLAITCPR